MSAFLFLLVKLNLGVGMAIVLVALLRRPLRAWFGAPIAYTIWFLVPIAGLAILLPPRVAPPVAHVMRVHVPAETPVSHFVPSALRAAEQLPGRGIGTIAAPSWASYAVPDIALLLFAGWALGVVLMALYLTCSQLRFHAAVRAGKAGPAVLGFLHPRIVTPDSFQGRFTPAEQAAILAHERVHLARQDARINALTAVLRCLCWFNPLIHLGARWLRIDQELACDATVVAGKVSRRDYAKALLKSQLMVMALPVGCNWPGSQHPLFERIASLKRKAPGLARRLAGVSLVIMATIAAGLGAWAAQPPVAAKPVAAAKSMALARFAAPVAHLGQTARAEVNPAADGNDVEVSKDIRADRPSRPLVVPARVQAPKIGSVKAAVESALALPSRSGFRTEGNGGSIPRSDASPEPKIASAKNAGEGPAIEDVTAVGPVRPSAAVEAAGARTEPALACLLGFVPWQCAYKLWGGDVWPITNCAKQYVHRWRDNCYDGPLEKVDYLGINAAGAAVYEVRYMHSYTTYIIAPPSEDGIMGQFWIRRGRPIQIVPASLAQVTASADPKITLYRRPWQ